MKIEASICTYLPTLHNLLREDAIVISDAISISCQAEGCHGIKEAGCQSTQASVTKTSILFYFFQLFNIQTQLKQQELLNISVISGVCYMHVV